MFGFSAAVFWFVAGFAAGTVGMRYVGYPTLDALWQDAKKIAYKVWDVIRTPFKGA